jgi:DNA polymerase-3 subunit gamma/tau
MFPTIVSRCQRFDFRKLTSAELVRQLEVICAAEKVKAEDMALEIIALQARGAVRDAESLLDQAITFAGSSRILKAKDLKSLLGLAETASFSQIAEFLCQKKASEALAFLNNLAEQGLNFYEFTRGLIGYLRRGLVLKIGGLNNPAEAGLTKEEFQKLLELANGFYEQDLRRLLNLLLEAENKIRYSPIPQLPLELAIIEACQSES